MGAWLDKALEESNLQLAWSMLQGDTAPWSPGISRDSMERSRLRYQLELLNAVRQGTYSPEAIRQFTVSKADGSVRVISALYLRDKFLQRAVLQAVTPIGERLFHPDSFAYRPHRSVYGALVKTQERVRCGLGWLVDADIQSFFDRIPRRTLLARVHELLQDRELLRLLDAWLSLCPNTQGELGQPRGIPQGAVLSPWLCNLYLHQVDQEWARLGIPFVRYADDFLLFLPDEARARQALVLTQHLLEREGLSLNPAKTQVIRASNSVRFLGHCILEHPKKYYAARKAPRRPWWRRILQQLASRLAKRL
ncbi:MAG: reverse transcriptase domain-containing protein [Xanthomonadales bacterium]|jgi:group II intron reverse transcriptase/maturase|nr:reverse transcriptase domain-containing protein [Xanthomonadales bacterium]